METKIENLPKDTPSLQKMVIELLQEKKNLECKNEYLHHQLIKALQHRYGQKSEKASGQIELPLFDEAHAEESEALESEKADEEITIASYQRKKSGRRPLSKDLPREQIIHDLPESQKICPCGHQLHKIGEEKSEQLEIIPAKIKVLEHVRFKYACRGCEDGVKIAPLPPQPIPKSIAGPGLLAHVLVSKFEDHLPLYRQEHMWQRLGVDIPRATLCNWVLKCGELLSPLTNLLKDYIISSNYVHADETPVQVLKEDGKLATSKSYLWVYMTGPPEKPMIFYEYQPTRSGKVPTDFLGSFKGYLQVDGYPGYNTLRSREDVTVLGCWAHVRRKFVEIVKTTKESGKAQIAVNFIAKLYAVEKKAQHENFEPDKVVELRKEKSKPVLERFKEWLDDLAVRVPPKSALGLAMAYTLTHWGSFNVYLCNGNLNIDNNPCENKIRPFALGRKNWLFMGNARGANAAATIFSLIETAKANGLEAYYYLRHVLTKIPSCETEEQLRALLPHLCDEEGIRTK
jgi:transposase